MRIQHLSEKRHLRTIVTWGLAPITWLRNVRTRRARRRGGNEISVDADENNGIDLEAGAQPLTTSPTNDTDAAVRQDQRPHNDEENQPVTAVPEEGSSPS